MRRSGRRDLRGARELPTLPPVPARALRRPISFVTVHFSDEIRHNLLLSSCVGDAFNQLIVVDNRENLFFSTLGAALLYGIAQAHNELIVTVHEDVLLLPGWQHAFEEALDALERHDPEWAIVGVVGWGADGGIVGHWSDPRGYCRLMRGQAFVEIVRIDEQIMALRKSGAVRPDPAMPSIHNIGRDLPRLAASLGQRSYVVDAPSVHKFADHRGCPILDVGGSRKIRARSSRTYLADRACSDAYLRAKWDGASGDSGRTATPAGSADMAPVILLACGGDELRLLSALAQDCGVVIGRELSHRGDARELEDAFYRLVLSRLRYRDAGLHDGAEAAILDAVAALHAHAGSPALWGFKLDGLMLLPEVLPRLFPRARFVHMLRDPLATCLRRTRLTARTDNQIGQAALLTAYSYAERARERILTDSPAMHMAITARHQVEAVLAALEPLPPSRHLALRFEEVTRDPGTATRTMRDWLTFAGGTSDAAGQRRFGRATEASISPGRAGRFSERCPADVEQAVAAELAPLRRRLEYLC